MNILIIGAKGMAGHMISTYLKENSPWNITAWGKEEFNVNDDYAWKKKIADLNSNTKLNYLINCVGILKPVSNPNPILAMKINALFPHELADLCTAIGTKIIHLGTDCWNDLDVYGRSKRAGEINYANHLTIRTSIIGPELKNNGCGLFHWFMTQKDEANGFVNHYWDGITTLELAKQIKNIIETRPYLGNIVDLRTKLKVNKFELLNYLNSSFKRNIKINKKETEIVDKSSPNPDIVCQLNLYEQIEELKECMLRHKENYQQYETGKHS